MKQSFGIMVGLCLLTGSVALGADPAWWRTQNTRIIDPAMDPQPVSGNYVPANLGQLKNVAKKAKVHLDSTLIGQAGIEVNNLVGGFSNNSVSENYVPINLGQLKRVGKVFYNRLLATGYNTRSNLIAHGFLNAGVYPWNPATSVSENYSPANIGQLKMVFCFDLTDFLPLGGVPDGDEMPDDWEEFYFGPDGALPNADWDGDTLTNLQEYLAGTDPTKKDSDGDGIDDNLESGTSASMADSDGDLIPDGWEPLYGTSPVVDNRAEDPEPDGAGRTLEHLAWRDSTVVDSKKDSSDRALDVFSVY